MPPFFDRIGIGAQRWHLRHPGWQVAELIVDLIGGQVAVGAAKRRGQIFVGGLRVNQKPPDVCVHPDCGVQDVLAIGF